MNLLYTFGALGLLAVGGVTACAVVAGSVETPTYAAVAGAGDFEVRDYPAARAAEVTRSGDRGGAVRAAFSPLASYIFAKERPGDKIAMTAPVTQAPSESAAAPSGEWTVRFLMPAKYTLADLPAPAQADVRLVEIPPRRMAAVRFSGSWTDAAFGEQTARLREWMATQGLTAVGAPVYAYYNDPFTPSFLRRNEVLIEVQQRSGGSAG